MSTSGVCSYTKDTYSKVVNYHPYRDFSETLQTEE